VKKFNTGAFSQQKYHNSFPLTQSNSGLVRKFRKYSQFGSNPNSTKFATVRIQSKSELAGVTFSDSNSTPVPKFLNPGPAIF